MPRSARLASDDLVSRELWFLDGLTEEGQSVRRVPLLSLPFLIGRLPGRGLTLSAPMISGRHAEIFEEDGLLKLRDLGSTNGTRLNGRALEGVAELAEGDILHFAKLEFRLGRVDGAHSTMLMSETLAVDTDLPELVVARSRILKRMMRERSVRAVFQPIVALDGERLLGYESLGRGGAAGMPVATGELFKSAVALGAEAELSRLLREESAAGAALLPADAALFINTHSEEIGSVELLDSLAAFRQAVGHRRVIVEIHEAAVTDPTTLCELGQELGALDFGLAYDDFGVGQARLLELSEQPPEFLKFDISLVRDLASASDRRRTLASSLVAMASDLGIATIAEGIETAADASACREAGFDYAQGFLFGRPLPAEEIAAQ